MYFIHLALIALATLMIGTLVIATGEWAIHRYVMHRKFWFITFPFHAHDMIHHGTFKGDETYFLENRPVEKIGEARSKIAMAFWAFLVLIPLGTLPFALVASPFVLFGWWSAWIVISLCGTLITSVYYVTYERIHWCMHDPKKRKMETWLIFRFLNDHHRIHHLFPRSKNFNVVFPFADWLFGTLRLDLPTIPEARASRKSLLAM